MAQRNIPLDDLRVNRANDRHGELENETSAIAWLFNQHDVHMRNLAKDIVAHGGALETPLIRREDGVFIVYDGNRRVTCLKLLDKPKRAPTVELQAFFKDLRAKWPGVFSAKVMCQIETDQDRIDAILLRRHTGSQKGIGQSTWTDRMKTNFVERTGQGGGFNVADEIERRLKAADRLPARKIPRSTLNRLLSSETFRNRVGFSVTKGRFELTHSEATVLGALQRIATDLATGERTLGHLWAVEGKRSYLDQLEKEGVLPTASQALTSAAGAASSTRPAKAKPSAVARSRQQATLIPQVEYGLSPWPGHLARHHAIWEELQFHLDLSKHPNAISVLFRVLLELSVENYIVRTSLSTINPQDKLADRAVKVAVDLQAKGKIDKKYLGLIKKLPQADHLFSLDTLNRYVHSAHFAPSPDHLVAMWGMAKDLVVLSLKA